ncbi:hypothetical protein QL093DRAFT_2460539 [Fusarium oxysporum]|nr:hypothetical protein QL093DRAFT_2460539 [Fusarium oxysporum]
MDHQSTMEKMPVSMPKKRNAADIESTTHSTTTVTGRPKRGKYTSVACDGCKKKKIKCIPSEDNSCERCITGGLMCSVATNTGQVAKEEPDRSQYV